jgi:acetyl-CoA acetyltransferase family protein
MDPFGPSVAARYAPGLVPQGVSAELIAARYGLTRRALDEFAAQSHQRAAAAAASGQLAREITPITARDLVIDRDETIRPSSTADALGTLQPAFRSSEMEARFPDIDWKVTAGNASQITDGAAAVLVMSEARAQSLGLVPRARFVAFDVRGDDPLLMLTAPIESTRRALARAGLTAGQIDQFEVNEAFASVPLAWQREHDVDPARLNPSGGAIALGHPLGASGARLMCTLLNGLERSGGRFGLQTMCEAGGMANTTIIERL